MKIDDIKKAFDSVSANGELKEKVFSRLDAELDTEDIPQTETFQIKPKKGGGSRFPITAFCTAAAVIATVMLLSRAVFNVDVIDDPETTETTSSVEEIPENTAHVTLKVVNEKGEPVKNVRIDYLPIVITVDEPIFENSDWATSYTSFDMENIDKAGTIPMTYGKDIELDIAYGEYVFYMSDALPNSQYRMIDQGDAAAIMYIGGFSMSRNDVSVGENTTEIVLTGYDPVEQYQYNYPKLGVILRGADGSVLPDEYTVILKPKNGVMEPGFSDEYGGYVLSRTDENGEAFWRGSPIDGEYEVIAYKEELHPISEPIKEPFVFGEDNTVIYKQNNTVSTYEKTFKQAE